MSYKIGISDYITPPAEIEAEAFPEAELIFLKDWRESEENAAEWKSIDALLAWHFPINAETTTVLDNCKIVVRYGVGFDTVDVQALVDAKIPFANTPDYGTEEVADAACAFILAIQRKTVLYDRLSRKYEEGTWQSNIHKPHERTNTCTLGILGVGRIGTAVINRMRPFGYKIVGYDPYQPSGHEKAIGYERVDSMDELISQADILSIHCPATKITTGMIDKAFIDKMKPGAALVNTARGAIVKDLSDIEAALRSGQLSMCGFDVLPSEPPQSSPLIDAWRNDEEWLTGRLLINPHAAYYSESGWYEMRYKCAETAKLFLEQGRLRNEVLPEI